ncbi:fatty acid-binding protein [Plakobranchus ocellatus]|uniref:Fatty acid-binding protein n=1 Tax=Plakobranchus ocellatus TaxID=259542 RepID=A0AAV3ZB32_9GAST|nr:fatty acid-binding protein [Plakobranchus ocellatus]
MDAIIGIWKSKKGAEENMEAFMDACKIPQAMRAVFMEREYEVTYTKGDGDNKFKTTIKILNDPKLPAKDYDFELGKDFEYDDIDGQHFKGCVTWDGKQFVEHYKDSLGNDVDIKREILTDGLMKLTMTCHGVSATIQFAKC